jgi:uncharacterized membrane-anchored protein
VSRDVVLHVHPWRAWAGLAFDKKLGFAVAVPLLLCVSWRVIHRVRRRVQGE